MTLSTPIDVGAGHVVQVVFDDVTNTAVAGSHTLTVSTSSDAAATASYATVPGGALSGVSVGLSSPAAGVRGVTYTVQFTASATGALAQNQGTITVAAAAGTVLPTCAVVKDITSGDSYSRCGDGEPGASVTLSTPIDVGAGHVVQVVFDDVTNTAVAGSHTLNCVDLQRRRRHRQLCHRSRRTTYRRRSKPLGAANSGRGGRGMPNQRHSMLPRPDGRKRPFLYNGGNRS